MKLSRFLIFMFVLHLFISPIFSQGCSDAGICSISALKVKHKDSFDLKYQHQFKLGAGYGKADHDINVIASFIEYHKEVNKYSSIDIRFAWLYQKNTLAKSYGPSDLFINTNWKLTDKLLLTAGCKLALSNGNVKVNNIALPLNFQHSLGTFDVILGLGYEIKGLHLFLAGQQRLNKSPNQFLTENYPVGSRFKEYQSTNKFKRKADILLRLAYPLDFNNGLQLIPALTPIYHLGNDKYTNRSGNEIEIIDSKGLTLNGSLGIEYHLNNHNSISLNIAAPLVSRKVRPDGLTRKFIAGLEYTVRL
jgi:hypothetical protein